MVDGIPPYAGQGARRESPPGHRTYPVKRILHRLGHVHAACVEAVKESRLALSRFPRTAENTRREQGNRGGH